MGVFGDVFGILFGKDKKNKVDPIQALTDKLAPYLQNYTDIANKYAGQADVDYGKASAGYDQAMAYYKNFMTGSRDNLLSSLDSSALMKGANEQQQQNFELAPRGGNRAATAANFGFSKFANLNSTLQGLRASAPGNISNLSQALANLAQGKLTAAMGGNAGASGLIFNTQQEADTQKELHNQLLASIFSAIGGAAGLAVGACNTLDTWILTNKGYKPLGEIRVNDIVMSPNDLTGLFEERKVIRTRLLRNQEISNIIVEGSQLSGTASHVLENADEEEIEFANLFVQETSLPILINESFINKKIKRYTKSPRKQDVKILKLENERFNYKYITNGFVSVDDYLNGVDKEVKYA